MLTFCRLHLAQGWRFNEEKATFMWPGAYFVGLAPLSVHGQSCFVSPSSYERCCISKDLDCGVVEDLENCCTNFFPAFGAVRKDVMEALSCDGISEWGRFA